MKKRVYVDMDGVLCDFISAYNRARDTHPDVEFPQSISGLFENLEPWPEAIESVQKLRALADVYVLSSPSARNPKSYTEKRIWIEKHFDYELAERLILSTDKSLLIGDYLIDDYASGNGQDGFTGELIQFDSERFPDWPTVLDYLSQNDRL